MDWNGLWHFIYHGLWIGHKLPFIIRWIEMGEMMISCWIYDELWWFIMIYDDLWLCSTLSFHHVLDDHQWLIGAVLNHQHTSSWWIQIPLKIELDKCPWWLWPYGLSSMMSFYAIMLFSQQCVRIWLCSRRDYREKSLHLPQDERMRFPLGKSTLIHKPKVSLFSTPKHQTTFTKQCSTPKRHNEVLIQCG